MNSPKRPDSAIRNDEFDDEFDSYLDEAKKNAQFRTSYDDAQARHGLIDCLVKLRRALGLSQVEVAQRMGVRQPTISGFENEGSDPRLSTLQRYARAVEACIMFRIDMPAECDWVSPSTRAYSGESKVEIRAAAHPSHRGDLAKRWAKQSLARGKFGLVA